MVFLVVRRAASRLFTLWAIVSLSYFCIYLLPGDPARIILGPQASEATILAFRHHEGLDQSWLNRYEHFLARTIRLDLGYSFTQRRSVNDLVVERSSSSMTLVGYATAMVLFAGLLLPLILLSLRFGALLFMLRSALQLFAFMPPYIIAIAALFLFSYQLHWIPVVFGVDRALSWIVAALALSAYPIALLLSVFVSRLSEELTQPYARRSLAQGFSRSHLLWREVLPNALPAALSVFSNNIAFFVTGAFFVEIVFGIPGMGRLGQQAIQQKDIPLLSGVCLAFAALVVFLSFLFDIAGASLSRRGESAS